MSIKSTTPVWGIDPDVVAKAMARGRLERSKAVWALLASLVGRRPEDAKAHGETGQTPLANAVPY